LERLHEKATTFFEDKYKITPEYAKEKISQLEEKARENHRTCRELWSKLRPLEAEQEKILLEYQRQKILMGISHDEEKIHKRLDELEKQRQPHKQTAEYTMMRAENQHLLDSISNHNFEVILQELSPEKQKALTKLQERERTIERVMVRGR
jgi:glucose-6-phosphate-specific signal transduction histidine kinase